MLSGRRFSRRGIFETIPSDIKEGQERFRSLQKPWEGERTLNGKEYPPKGYHIICSICGGSIHEPNVFLQYKRGKLYPCSIWLDVKVWDLFKDLSLLTWTLCISILLNIRGWIFLPRAEASGALSTASIGLRDILYPPSNFLWFSYSFRYPSLYPSLSYSPYPSPGRGGPPPTLLPRA